MNFVRNVNIDLGHIYYKYGCNQGLDSKVRNPYLTVCQRVWSTSQIIMLYFERGVQNIVYTLFYISFNGIKYYHLFVE